MESPWGERDWQYYTDYSELPLCILQLDPADRAVIRIADERDAVQKKTFTKWVNKHLLKAGRKILDLYEDLRDGHNLISLLEVLAHEILPRERGHMRFHKIQNVQIALDFLRMKGIKLVNIRSDEIVDGNPKLTLGLIWTIILHFQISDVVVPGQEDITAKDALLLWSRRTTDGYPGVRIRDFSSSWRDGRAFLSILHRNRPDLVDMRQMRQNSNKQNLESAFNIAERELGVTRLLDADDVDVPNPDEKSIITYVSSLYDVFPEVPSVEQSLKDNERKLKVEEYREYAASLLTWIRECIKLMLSRNYPTALTEIKILQSDFHRFRSEDVPPRLEVRNKLLKLFDEIQSLTSDPSQMSIEDEFLPHNVSRMWSRFETAMQERDMTLQAEVIRLERLHRLAEKVQRDIRYNEETLADLSRKIEDTVRGQETMHAFEAKRNCDALDRALKSVEESLRGLFRDCQTLQDGTHPHAEQLYKRVSDLQARVSSLRNRLHSQLLHPLMARPGHEVREHLSKTQAEVVSEGRLMETHPAFRHLQDCLDWIDTKQRHLEETKYESQVTLVLEQLAVHKAEHEEIQAFRSHIDKCVSDRANLSSEEQKVYTQKLSKVEVAYSLLSKTSSRRLRCLESLGEFIQLATTELLWLSEREEVELSRDWGAKDLNLAELDEYHKSLVRQMESRESHFNAVQEKGGAMILDRHPSARIVEALMSSLQSQWSWLVQLRWCLEAQIKHCADHNTFFQEAQHCEQWMARHSELLQNRFSSDNIPIDHAQILLAELQDLQDQIREYDRRISSLVVKSRDVVPLKLRSQRVSTPVRVRTLCACHQQDVSLQRGEECFLVNNSQRSKWKVKTMTGLEADVPSVCLLIPPPNQEAIDVANRLKLQHDRLTSQWKTQQRQVRMAAIFAAIRQIKNWDLKKFLAMEPAQREAVWRALKEDGQKLIAECGTSDRDMRKLSEELKECERIYLDLCEKAAAKESHRGIGTGQAVLQRVETLSRELSLTDQHLSALLHRPLAQNNLTVQESFRAYREFQLKFDKQESEMRVLQMEVKELFPRNSNIESKLNLVVQKTEQMKVLSHLYVDRLKGCEVVISGLNEIKQLIKDFESSLASHDNMTSDLSELKTLKNELVDLQESLQQHQPKLQQLKEDVESLRTLVERSRPGTTKHHDVDSVEKEVDDLTKRWDQICIHVVERMRSVGSCQNLLTLYHNGLHTEQTWASQMEKRISSQPTLNGDVADAKRQLEPTMAIYNSLGDRRHQIESVNRHGGQFIREAKIADKRLRQFKDSLAETDRESNVPDSKKLKHQDGSDVVRDELDRLNKMYMEMVDWANVRLKEIAAILSAHGELQFQMVIDEEMPLLRTFRAELAKRSSMLVDTDMKEYFTQQFEGPTPSQASYGSTPDHLYKTTLQLRPESTKNAEFAEVTKVVKLQPKSHHTEEPTERSGAASPRDLSMTLKAMENSSTPVSILSTATSKFPAGKEQYTHREQIMITIKKEEITPRGQVLHVAAVFNPATTRKVTLVEALRIGLLDPKTKSFTDPSTRQRLPLSQAAKKGFIDEVVLKQLTTPCGAQDPQTGEELSILDAIQKKLYDPSSNTFTDVTAEEQVSVPEAVARGIISESCSRILIGETVEVTSVTRTRAVFTDTEPFKIEPGLSLGAVLEKNLCSEITGRVNEPLTGTDMNIMEAVEKGYIDPSCHEIKDPKGGSFMTLTEAVASGVVNPFQGTYNDQSTGEKLSLSVALSKGLVRTAFSLADAVSQGSLTEDGQVFDQSSGQILPLAEAFDTGVISINKKCILNPQTDEVMSVKDAISNKLMTPSGLFMSPDGKSRQPVLEALTSGLVRLAHEDIQFSRSGVKDPRINEVVTLAEAFKRGIITPQGSYVDSRTGREMSLQQASNAGLVDSSLMKDLHKPTSIRTAQGRHISLAEALKLGIVDAQTGSFENARTRERHTMQEAVTIGLIAASDATKVLSLLSSVTTTTTVLTQVESLQPAGALTISQAISQGYLNEKTGMYRDPKTGLSMPLDEAIRRGLLKLSSEGTVPPSLSAFRNDIDSQNNRLLSETFMTDTSKGTSRTIPIEPGSKKFESSYMTKTDSQYSFTTTTLAKPLLMHSVISETREITLKSVLNPRTGKELDVEDAIKKGLINIENGQYMNPITGEKMTLNRAIEKGLIKAEQVDGSQKGGIAIKDTRVFSIVGVLHPVTRQRLTVSQALAEGFLDQTHGVYNFVDAHGNLQPMKISEAIEKGYVLVEDIGDLAVGPDSMLRETKSYILKAVVHPITGKHLSIADAIAEGILDESEGHYINPLTGERLHIHSAIEKGFIIADLTSVKTEVDKNVNKITTTKLTTLAVTAVVDPRTGNLISVSKAIEDGILNQTKGIYTNPLTGESMTLSDAIDKRLVLAESPEAQSDDPLEKAEISSIHITDEQESHETTLIEDVHSETVTMSISSVVDPATMQMISYDRAVDSGILDVRKGLYINPFSGETMTISAALEKGLIQGEITSKRRDDDLLRSAVSSATSTIPLKDITSVIDPRTQEEISFDKAVKDGIINPEKGTYINPRTHTEIDLTKAKELGYLLESKQSSASQLEKSIEEEDLLQARLSTPRLPRETSKPWSQVDMQLEKTVTIDGSTRDDSVAKEVLHYSAEVEQSSDAFKDRGKKPQSLLVVDPTTGEKMAMDVALEKGLVDASGSVVDRQTGKKLSPQEALKMGLMVVAGAPFMAGKMVVDAIKDRNSNTKTVLAHSEVIPETAEPHMSPFRTLSKSGVQPGVASTRSGHWPDDNDQQVDVIQVDRQRSPGSPVVGVVGKPVTITVDPGLAPASPVQRTSSATTITFQQRMSMASSDDPTSDLTGAQSHRTVSSSSKYDNATASEQPDKQDSSFRIPTNLQDIKIKSLKMSNAKDVDINWETGIVTEKLSSKKLTVKEAVQKGVIDSDLIQAIAESATRKSYVNPDISIDWLQGSVTDQSTDETMSVEKAFQKGLINMPTASALASISDKITQFTGGERQTTSSHSTEPYTLNKAVKDGMYNSKTGQIVDPNTGLEMSVKEALDRNIISGEASTVVDPRTGQEVPLRSAIDSKMFDAVKGELVHKNLGQKMSLLDAHSHGLIPSDDNSPPLAKGAKPQVPAKPSTKHKEFEGKERAHSARNISPDRLLPDDRKLSFAEALDKGLISLEDQQYLDPKTGQRIPLSDAIRDQVIDTTVAAESGGHERLTVTQAIDRGLFDDQSGVFHDPKTNKDMSLQEAGDRGHVDGSLTVFDVKTGDVYSLEEGMRDGRIDAVTGEYVDEESGQKMTLKEAAKLGVLALVGAPVAAAIAAKESLSSFLGDSKTKDSSSEGRGVSFPASIGRQLSPDSRHLKHSLSGSKSPDSLTLSEAISSGHLSTKTGIFTDPNTGRSMQIRDAVMSGLIDKDSATIQDAETGRAVNLEYALQHGMLDDRGRVIDSQTGLGKDLKQCISDGTLQGVQLQDMPLSRTADQDKAVDMLATKVGKMRGESLAEVASTEEKVLTIDAVKDTKTGRNLTLSEAVKRGIIDEEGEYFKDLRTNEVIPVNEAIRRGLVTSASLGSHEESEESYQKPKVFSITQSSSTKIQSIIDPATNREMPASQAIEKGILNMSTGELINTRTGEAMAIDDALKQGLLKGAQTQGSARGGREVTRGYSRDEIDAQIEELAALARQDFISNGEVASDVQNKRRLTSESENGLYSGVSVRGVSKDGSVDGKEASKEQKMQEAKQIRVSKVYDPLTGLKVGLDEAIERGLVDENCSVFNDPVTGAQMKIEDAMKEGLVAGFIQTVSTSQSSVTSKKSAGTYNITGVLDTESGQELSVEEAMNRKILDPSGTYTDPLTGEVIPLAEAMKLGYVLSEKVKKTPLSSNTTNLQKESVTFQDAMENGQINPNDGSFFDESSHKTYSVDEAVRSGLIVASDGRPFEYRGISDAGVTYSFKAALQTGIISSETCLFYDSLTGECISIEAALQEGYLSPVAGTFGGRAVGESIVMLKDGVASSAASTLEEIIDSKTGEKLSLAEAEKRGLVSVVKNNQKMTLGEAITSGLVDSNSGLFHDPVTGESMSIDQAVMSNVITVDDVGGDVLGNGYQNDTDTDAMNLAAAISQGYLDTTTATFTDPFTQETLSVSQAIQKGLLKPTLTVEEPDAYHPEAMDGMRDSTNILSRSRKVTSDVLHEASYSDPDSAPGLTQKEKTTRMSSLKDTQPHFIDDENISGVTSHETSSRSSQPLARHSTSQDRSPTPGIPGRMADSYDKLVEDISTQLHRLQDFEQVLKEDTQMGDGVSKIQQQLDAHKALHEDILGHQQPILSLVYQAEQLTEHYQEEITPEQVTALSADAASLKKALEKVVKTSDRRLKHLTAAADELSKVETEVNKFNKWKEGARSELLRQEECLQRLDDLQPIQDSQKELMSDIMSHQADVRYISISVQKYVEEAKLHKLEVDSYRADRQRPARSSLISMDCVAADLVRDKLKDVTDDYTDLKHKCSAFGDRLSELNTKQRNFNDAAFKMLTWLVDTEDKLASITQDSDSPDPGQLEGQLARVKSLSSEVLSQSGLMDEIRKKGHELANSFSGMAADRNQVQLLEENVRELDARYSSINEAVSGRVKLLQATTTQSQGIQGAITDIQARLRAAQVALTSQQPISLELPLLAQQEQQFRLLAADVHSYADSVESIREATRDLIKSGDLHVAKALEQQLADIDDKFQKVHEACDERGKALKDVGGKLGEFHDRLNTMQNWLQSRINDVTCSDFNSLPVDEAIEQLSVIVSKKKKNENEIAELKELAKELREDARTGSPASINKAVAELEKTVEDFDVIVGEKQADIAQREKQASEFEVAKTVMLLWLAQMEARADEFEPPAIEVDVVEQQIADLQPMLLEYEEQGPKVDEINDLGNALEILTNSGDRPLSPIRRFGRSRRIIGLTSPHLRSPSPTFPLSPTAMKTSMSSESSGVSSRKSSSDNILLDDLSETQQQLLDINQRYEILGERLADRQQELQNVLASIKTFLQDMQDVLSWLDVKDGELSTKSADGISANEKTAKKKLKEHEEFHRELLNKEGLVEDIRKKAQELLKSKPGVPGLDSLQSQLTDLDEKWHGLRAASEEHRKSLEDAVTDLCDFREYEDQLSKWFSQKEKLMDVLGPVAMEPSLLKSQMEQVKVLKEEFASQEPTLEQFMNTGHSILDWCHDNSSDNSAISKRMDTISKSWRKLQGRLKEREKNIESLQGLSGEFSSVSRELANWLGEFNDRIDELPKVGSQPDKQQAQKLEMQQLQEEMQDKLPEITKAKNLCQQLCDTTKELSTKTDLKAKMAALDKDINDTLKKLESRASAIEEASKAGKEFNANCQQIRDWVQTTSSVFMDTPPLSCDSDLLQKQAIDTKAMRQDLNLKEAEIRSLLDKGNRFLLDASPTDEARALKDTLTQIEHEWVELKEAVKDREEKIKAASTHAQDFQQNLDKMAWWLGSAEERLKKIKPESLDKASIAAKLKELQSLQNELLKKSHDHDNFNRTAVSLLAAVEDPGNELQQQVDDVNHRWDLLSSDLSERAESLEELQSRLAEIEDNKLDAKHSLTRWEDKLAAHLDMGTAARDPKHIDKIKAIQDDISAIQPQLEYLDKLMEGLDLGEDVDSTDLESDLKALRSRYDQLQGEVEELISNMETGSSIVGQFQDMMKKVAADLSDLDDNLSNMKPVSRDENELEAQLQEIQNFQAKLANKSEPLVDLKEQARDLQLAGFVSEPDGLNSQVEALLGQYNRLKESTDDRLADIESNIDKVHTVSDALKSLRRKTHDAVSTIDSMKPVGSSANQIKEQQEELRIFNKNNVEPLQKEISMLNNDIEALIKTAPSGVNTGGIDEDLEGLHESWAELNDKVSERERNLGKALLQSGKFKEALASLLAWMEETEETVANQKPPSPEFRVVKAQLQEQKLLQKMIDDRASSVMNVKETGEQLLSGLEGPELNRMDGELQSLDKRWTALTGNASERMETLEEISKLAKDFQDIHEPLVAWLEVTDKKFTSLEPKSSNAAGFEKLINNLKQMQSEISEREGSVRELAVLGKKLQDFCKGEDVIIVQLKIDEVQKQFGELKNKVDDSLDQMEEALPLAQNFQEAHEKFMDWAAKVEPELRGKELLGADAEEKVQELLQQLDIVQPYLDIINSEGSELAEIAPGDAGLSVEDTVKKDNKRFDGLRQQIEKRAEKVNVSRQKSLECINELDDLMEWFDKGGDKLNTMSAISAEPGRLQKQLAEMKSFNEEVNNQKVRARDAVTSGKKLLRDSSKEDVNAVQEKMEQLKNKADSVSSLTSERLSSLEQALPLARSFQETHDNLVSWLDEVEPALADLEVTTVDAHQVRKQQESIKALKQDVADHKPVVDRLNKTGAALVQLVSPESAVDVQNKLDDDNQRVEDVRSGVRERSNSIDAAMQQSAEFTDKLEDMLETLTTTAESMQNVEPISAFPDKIREQLEENKIVDEDMQMKSDALESVKEAANELIRQAGDATDPAVRDVRQKLEELTRLYSDIQDNCHDRNRALEDALGVSEKFWEDLNTLSGSIKELQDGMNNQEKPALEPEAIREQQEELEVIRDDLAATQADLEDLQDTGDQLMALVGDPERPEIKKNLDDTEQTLNNLNIQVEQRSKDLDIALSRAVTFQQELQKMLVWLQTQEETFDTMEPVASDLDTITSQWNDIKVFKGIVDPKHVEVEALNQQAQELTKNSTAEQATVVIEPVREVNQRWDALQVNIADRQRDIQTALLNLGQFDQAYKDFQSWLDTTDQALEQLEPVYGDPKLVDLELAKLRVITNDIAAHQENLDLLSEAANKMMAREKAPEAQRLKKKMDILARDLDKVKDKAAKRQSQLEDARREARGFTEELQDILMKINDLDGQLITSQPVGGLPETAKEQLQKFMNTFGEIEQLEPSVESLQLMSEKLAVKSHGEPAASIRQNMANLQQRWGTAMSRAADRKKKLEDAVGLAGHFHEELNKFIGWLTDTEKTLNNLQPVSRLVDKVTKQIEDHRVLQKDVSGHREAMFALDKMGTHLKYFSQKQDVVLIKNLLTSAQHRWEKIVSRSAERTRHLERGYKEAKQFYDSWKDLIQWLSEAEQALNSETSVSNEPEKIRAQIAKHKEFQRRLGAKQPVYDSINRAGSTLQTKCPGHDKPALQALLNELKNRWNSVCGKSVDRQRKLEEGLLFTGQFNEALEALLDWLAKVEPTLAEDTQVHGDLDTVSGFLDTHKAFQQELGGRATTVQFVRKSGKDLIEKSSEDMSHVQSQLVELATLWDRTCKLSVSKQDRLEQAHRLAQEFHSKAHGLLDWLAETERQLRFKGAIPDDEAVILQQIDDHKKFEESMLRQEANLRETLNIGQDIMKRCHPDAVSTMKHWLGVLRTRWEELMGLSRQRQRRLTEALTNVRLNNSLLEELLAWLNSAEVKLTDLDREPIPKDLQIIQDLIAQHQDFQNDMSSKQPSVDRLTKADKRKAGSDSASNIPVFRGARSSGRSKIPTIRIDRVDSSGRKTPDYFARKTPEHFHSQRTPNVSGRRTPDVSGRRTPDVSGRRTPDISGRMTPDHSGRRTPDHTSGRRTPDVLSGRRTPEPGFHNPRVGALFNKWRHVWLLSMYRQRKLQDALDYLNEVERMKHFDFEDWRKRYLRWMNHNKARIMDFFRRQDHDRDGRVTRQEFIDGILQSKFPTSRLEMEAVADIFDKDGDGFINYKQFVAALRPDRDPKPETDSEKILDEVRRQVSKCTCMKQFKIHKIGEGKYRFGDSQKLRLVRILRSTVMVRVGGGWIALDEFLVKNDPCRAKGRTNMELRENFVLAEGVSQSMSGFVSKSPAGSSHSSGSSYSAKSASSASGPITKIREKTVHQTPWRQTKVSPDGEVHQIMSHTDPDGSRVVKHKVTQDLRSARSIASPASRSSSRASTASGSRPTSRTGFEAPDDTPEIFTTVQNDSRNVGGRSDTTVTYQTHSVQTRNVTLPTTTSSKISKIPKIASAKKK